MGDIDSDKGDIDSDKGDGQSSTFPLRPAPPPS
jgi:hypothetical protein